MSLAASAQEFLRRSAALALADVSSAKASFQRMPNLLPQSLLLLLAATLPSQAPPAVTPAVILPAAIELIDRSELLQHASVLAADAMRGRLTGTPEQGQAAAYVAEQFAALGLEPLGDADAEGKRGWLQHYSVVRTSLSERAGWKLGVEAIKDGYAVLPWRDDAAVEAEGELTLLDPEGRKIDDLAGKIGVLLPKTQAGKGVGIEQQFAFSFTFLQRVTRAARNVERAGGKVLVVGLLDDEAAVASVLNYVSVAPGKPIVKPGEALAALVGGGDEMGMLVGGKARVPIVFTSAKVTGALLGAMGVKADAARAWVFDGGEQPKTEAAAASLTVELVTEEVQASNVAAVLRGSDEQLAGEAVVFSAHMDHVGLRLDGNAFNGADDNASGTSGLLEIAQAFARSDDKPRRSVIFLAVSGEELGLWGSAWYAAHPTWEAKNLIANVNTDMIGRGGPDAALGQVMLTPSYKHPQYSTMARAAAQAAGQIGLELVADDKFYMRSDHYKFIEKGIPAVFFCCAGEHEDYHQVTDHADLLDPEQMEKTARLAFYVGWAAANADTRPQVLGRCDGWLGEPRKKRGKKD
jgi:hypothetical protein